MTGQVGKITTELMLSINRFLDAKVNLSVLHPDLDLLFPIIFLKII